ncbi:MAG TPA: hypothetical protein VMD29_14370 [Terracidiphilus sp.]|nr:hypothetical protein [Terracidiphilus sp.]
MNRIFIAAFLFLALAPLSAQQPASQASKVGWRQATDAELAALLPARAPVEKERIETEMRTASGIVDTRGRFIAGVVLITAGYSADGKYSHYLVVQAPIKIGGVDLRPGEYVFGWVRDQTNESLKVHFHVAATGALVGNAEARMKPGTSHEVVPFRIWPPNENAILQIGRFAIPYELEP